MADNDKAAKNAAQLVDAIATALELNIARNALVDQVQQAVLNGLPLDQVGDYVERMVAEKLAHMQKQ